MQKMQQKTVQFLYTINTFSKIFFTKSGNNTTTLPTFAPTVHATLPIRTASRGMSFVFIGIHYLFQYSPQVGVLPQSCGVLYFK